jgi:hypothetical protein
LWKQCYLQWPNSAQCNKSENHLNISQHHEQIYMPDILTQRLVVFKGSKLKIFINGWKWFDIGLLSDWMCHNHVVLFMTSAIWQMLPIKFLLFRILPQFKKHWSTHN